jgi:hypothetical protein
VGRKAHTLMRMVNCEWGLIAVPRGCTGLFRVRFFEVPEPSGTRQN